MSSIEKTLKIKDLSKFWMFYASLWHGHEIIGFDNIPDDGSALIIMFHAPIPIDTLYLGANVLLRKKRMIRCVVERAVFNGVRIADSMLIGTSFQHL